MFLPYVSSVCGWFSIKLSQASSRWHVKSVNPFLHKFHNKFVIKEKMAQIKLARYILSSILFYNHPQPSDHSNFLGLILAIVLFFLFLVMLLGYEVYMHHKVRCR